MFRDSWPKSHPLEPRTPVYHITWVPPPPPGAPSHYNELKERTVNEVQKSQYAQLSRRTGAVLGGGGGGGFGGSSPQKLAQAPPKKKKKFDDIDAC